MKPWHGNFLFKGVCTLLISSLGDFGKKERGIGSLAAGWGKLRSARPRGWTQEVGRSRRGCPHIGVSVSVVKSRDLQPPVPESRGFLLPGWREGFEGRRGLRSALLIGGSDVDGVVDGVVPLPIVLATPPISCGLWAIREELDTPWRLSPCSSPTPPTPALCPCFPDGQNGEKAHCSTACCRRAGLLQVRGRGGGVEIGWGWGMGFYRMGAETPEHSDLSSNPLSLQQHKPQPFYLRDG